MTKDPIIAEIRRFRDQFARKHGYSIRPIAEDLKTCHAPKSIHPAKRSRTARKVAS